MPERLIVHIDDDPGILRLTHLVLGERGFKVLTSTTSSQGLVLIEKHQPDLIMLEMVMPEMPGLEILRQIREKRNVPVILVTKKRNPSDEVLGLELGADDYITKPFNPKVLTARVETVLKRTSPPDNLLSEMIITGGLEIDLNRKVVTRNDNIISLTRTEWNLLQLLATNQNKLLTNPEILSKVWGPEYANDLQYLRVWIARLRKKLGNNSARIIKTFSGVGYMLVTNPESVENSEGGAKE